MSWPRGTHGFPAAPWLRAAALLVLLPGTPLAAARHGAGAPASWPPGPAADAAPLAIAARLATPADVRTALRPRRAARLGGPVWPELYFRLAADRDAPEVLPADLRAIDPTALAAALRLSSPRPI